MMLGSGNMAPQVMLRYALAELWARRWLVFAVTAGLCVAGWLFVASLPDRYNASARIYVDTQSLINPLMKGLTVVPDVGQQVDIMRGTLLSRPNMDELIRATDLDLTVTSPREHAALARSLQNRIVIAPEQERLFRIEFEDPDPELAQRVVQALLSIFVEQNIGNNRRDMEHTREFIDRQIAEHEQRLRETETMVAEFKRANAQELNSRQRYEGQLASLEGEIRRLEAEIEAAVWKRDQLKVELARTPPTVSVARAGGVPSAALRRVEELHQTLQSLQLRYTDRHPDVIATKQLLEAAEAELAAEGGGQGDGTVANPTYTQIEKELREMALESQTLKLRLESRKSEIADIKEKMAEVPEVELQLAQLNRDYEVLRQNYSQLIERRESAKLAQDLDDQTRNVEFRIVEPPVVPLTPTGPKRLAMFSGVLVGAVGAGLAVVFLLLQMRDSFTTLAQVKESFGLPVLGSVSMLRTGLRQRLHGFDVGALTIGWAGLLATFAGLIYVYEFAAPRPDIAAVGRQLFSSVWGPL